MLSWQRVPNALFYEDHLYFLPSLFSNSVHPSLPPSHPYFFQLLISVTQCTLTRQKHKNFPCHTSKKKNLSEKPNHIYILKKGVALLGKISVTLFQSIVKSMEKKYFQLIELMLSFVFCCYLSFYLKFGFQLNIQFC